MTYAPAFHMPKGVLPDLNNSTNQIQNGYIDKIDRRRITPILWIGLHNFYQSNNSVLALTNT
jgi:hypothetical protein